ncbi:MAG: preprotein translocase subunit SecY [Candidatus Obscuribacterales bacterium]|nr:preprotein translocase subunit SecY [Candidatus Obscuribacterales bacterium]
MTHDAAKRKDPIGGPGDLLTMLSAAGLKERIFFTAAMIAIYRIGVHIPLPGVDPMAMTKHPELAQNLLGMIDLFTGGALGKLSIFSMGIGPYITASIIMQLMAVVIPKLEDLQKNSGEAGRRQLSQYTRYLTVGLATMQSYMLARLLTQIHGPDVVIVSGPLFLFSATVILAASAMFIMWLGEVITERGVGNGASLLIFLGIASRLPSMIAQTSEAVQSGQVPAWGVAVLGGVFLLLIALVVCLQQGVRKIKVLGARRQAGNKQGIVAPDDYLYLPVNPSGVMAIIFSSSLLMFPTTIMQFLGKSGKDPMKIMYDALIQAPGIGAAFKSLSEQGWAQQSWGFVTREFIAFTQYNSVEHSLVYFALIIFFAFFYASIVLPTKDMAENLRRSGRAIQGVKPGRPTSEFLEATLNRLIFIGATAIAIVAIIPIHVEHFTGVVTLQGLGSTSLIILVGVAIDTQRQIITHALSAKYQARGLFKGSNKKDS